MIKKKKVIKKVSIKRVKPKKLEVKIVEAKSEKAKELETLMSIRVELEKRGINRLGALYRVIEKVGKEVKDENLSL